MVLGFFSVELTIDLSSARLPPRKEVPVAHSKIQGDRLLLALDVLDFIAMQGLPGFDPANPSHNPQRLSARRLTYALEHMRPEQREAWQSIARLFCGAFSSTRALLRSADDELYRVKFAIDVFLPPFVLHHPPPLMNELGQFLDEFATPTWSLRSFKDGDLMI